MKAWGINISTLLFLFLAWFALKSFGLTGRQFSDGLNISEKFSITSIGQNFKLKIQPYKRGIYRYNASLVFDGKDFLSDNLTQDIKVKFTETICGSPEVIGSSILSIKSTPGRSSMNGLGRYGKVTKTGFIERSKPVCLQVEIVDLSQPLSPNLELKVYALNTRPCWGIECMLD